MSGDSSWEEYMRDEEVLAAQQAAQEARRGLKAMALAPTLGVYEALLKGQEVPVSALDPEGVRRYGVR